MSALSKSDWVLLLLHHRPLDRIRLMKALFLIWHRTGRQLKDFYEFTPYLYGPCSFDLYTELEALQREHFVSQAPHPVAQWGSYYLTQKGVRKASAIHEAASREVVALIRRTAEEVASLNFNALLRRVYSEAPDFASRTIFPWRATQ